MTLLRAARLLAEADDDDEQIDPSELAGVLVSLGYNGRVSVTIVESGKANRLGDAGGIRSTRKVHSPIT